VTRRRRAGGLGLAGLLPALTLLAAVAVHSSSAAAGVRISLPDSVPDWAVPADAGAPAPSQELVDLAVYMSWRDPDDVTALAEAVSDPESPRYGHYLSARDFRERFSPDQADVDAVSAWLRTEGLGVVDIPANRHYVVAQGTVARVEAAFGTHLAEYRVGDRVLRGPTAAPSTPALHGVVAVGGLDEGGTEMRPDHMTADVPAPPGFVNAPPCSRWWGERLATDVPAAYGAPQPYVPCGYDAAALRSAYDLEDAARQGLDGRGQTVAVTDAYASPTILDDVDRLSRDHGVRPFARGQLSEVLPAPRPGPQTVHCDAGGWYAEESLDIEAVHLLAPRARVVYASARDCSNLALDEAITTVLDGQLAQVVTNSWGTPGESSSRGQLTAFADTFLQAAIEGIGVIFASGDGGDQVARRGMRTVDFPASAPWVTSVGGTSLGIGAHGERVFETGFGIDRTTLDGSAWTAPPGTFLYGSGGGTSRIFAQPRYQARAVPAALATYFGPHRARTVPDIAMDGDPNTGIIVGVTQTFPDGLRYGEYRIGGTSLAAPLVAAVELLADQRAGMHHGFLNPALYRLRGTRAIRDVRALPGPMAMVRVDYVNRIDASAGLLYSLRTLGQTHSLQTARGYDDVTGLGVPRGTALIEALDTGRRGR
jgi:subtilase family serine protease